MLGSLELLTLLAVRLEVSGPPAAIYRHIAVEAAKPPTFGSVYTTLDRLVTKNLLVEERGRARARIFKLSEEGRRSLKNTVDLIDRMRGQGKR